MTYCWATPSKTHQHGAHSVTWPKLCCSMTLDCSDVVTGAQNSRQLFALIVRRGSALLTTADSLLINGKCCIYILVSGTTHLLR